ncbi:MAG: cytochrome P450, partial [Acidimicrobiales bacterium]
ELAAGSKLLLFYNSANRDEDIFENPFDFDVRRDPNPHVGFGGPGPHFCLGAHLARREITVMFRELFRRVPDMMVVAEPARLRSSCITGRKHLEVEVTPGGVPAGAGLGPAWRARSRYRIDLTIYQGDDGCSSCASIFGFRALPSP